jgi:hypothetical protein
MPPWDRERETDSDVEETEAKADDDLPSFLNEATEDDEELEALTDGGDEDES